MQAKSIAARRMLSAAADVIRLLAGRSYTSVGTCRNTPVDTSVGLSGGIIFWSLC